MMSICYRTSLITLLILVFVLPAPLQAQEVDSTRADDHVADDHVADDHASDDYASDDYASERDLIESTLGTFVKVIRTAAFRDEDPSVSDRLQLLATRLNAVNQSLPGVPMTAYAPADDSTARVSITELQGLETSLNELYDLVRDMRMTMEAEDNFEVADRLATVEKGLDDAVVQTRRLIRSSEVEPKPLDDQPAIARTDERREDEWLRPGEYREGSRYRTYDDDDEGDTWITVDDAMDDVRRGISEARDAAQEAHTYSRKRTYYRYREPRSPFESLSYADAYVGEFYNRWPFRETGLYRPVPAIRYNRVEGLVLGARILPLEWGDWENARIYGQVGYAFELKDFRYEVGAEFRPFPYVSDNYDFKLGASYRSNTTTNDLWKVNWVENTIAALLFEYDFMDYYQVDGFSFYAIQRLSPFVQLSAGYRAEDYSSLENNTTWSLFGTRDFRLNPAVSETLLQSFVFALEGGELSGMYTIPRGFAFRFEAELGEGFNDDFDFNRYLGDVRVYVPFGYSSSFGVRLRGGYVSDEAPFQKLFTLGGVGSVRAYAQNRFVGSRMLLANVEYTIASVAPLDDIFDDIQLFGFGDAGWVNSFGNNEVDLDDVYPAAGVGLSFADRSVRLELAWPLKDDFNGERDPTLWLRLTPTF